MQPHLPHYGRLAKAPLALPQARKCNYPVAWGGCQETTGLMGGRCIQHRCNWPVAAGGCQQTRGLRGGRCPWHRCLNHIHSGTYCPNVRPAHLAHHLGFCHAHQDAPPLHQCSFPLCQALVSKPRQRCATHNACVVDGCRGAATGGVGSACEQHRCRSGCTTPGNPLCNVCLRGVGNQPHSRRAHTL